MNASGVPKQASHVWNKHLQVLASIVQRVATNLQRHAQENIQKLKFEQASQGY